ncbi:putative glycosyltransferase [Synechococcus sp. WH 5701]|nr:putative glycosyltransferase [Synechococcus sp. WH 5701]
MNCPSRPILIRPQPPRPAAASLQVLIPARDEAAAIAAVIQELRGQGLERIRVVDNGSGDDTAAVASAAGAEVVVEPRPGYGRACWRGLGGLPPAVEWIFFCDGDGSDDLAALPRLLAAAAEADLVLGNRLAGAEGRRAMTPLQRFGNRLATRLIQLGWGHRYRDLGPMRLIRRPCLEALALRDRGFGWTLEMQVRAVEQGCRIREVPVGYRPRQGGRSKISGSLLGSLRAGEVILRTLGGLYLARISRGLNR